MRAFALLLGIVLHAVMPYLQPPVELWPTIDSNRSTLYYVFVLTVHAFRLQVFFLLAGYFTALLIEKRGAAEFVRNRFFRIVIPFLLSVAVLVPIMQFFTVLGFQGRESAGYVRIDQLIADKRAFLTSVSDFFCQGIFVSELMLYHLWFLYYLVMIYAAFLFGLWIVKRSDRLKRLSKAVANQINQRSAIFWLPLITAMAMWPMHLWQVDTPFNLIPQHWILLYYLLFFVVGYSLFYSKLRLRQIRRDATWHFRVATVVLPFALLLQTMGPNPANRPYQAALELPAILCYSIFTWCTVFGLLGAFANYFQKPSQRTREISDSSYWQYLIHLPLLFVIQYFLHQVVLPSWLEVGIQVLVGYFLLMLSYRLLVKRTWVGVLLNGKRIQDV